MKPVIGVMPLFDNQKDSIWMLPAYLDLLEKYGAIPLILPLTTNQENLDYFLGQCDGFLFTGGQDVSPELYGALPSELSGEPCLKRDKMEIYCMQKVIAMDKPLLGICRGIQVLNVVNGGTLYQDIAAEYSTQIAHDMTAPYDRTQHSVKLLKEGPLFQLLEKENLGVNSYHHQAIKDLAPNLEATALSADDLIEAVYMPDKKFVWAVQWHPEFFGTDTVVNERLFKAFIAKC